MNYLEIINFRHACKVFDESKKVSRANMYYILEAGRVSPSSTGLEQWDFLVITNDKLKAKLRPKCWNQAQITSCSHLVVILAKIADIKSDSKYVSDMIVRRPYKTPEEYAGRVAFYKDFIDSNFKNDDELLYTWAHAQTMFAANNMMNAAASLGIDSCPIEGFEQEAVGEILGIDKKKHRVAILVPFGYRLNPQPKKYRREINDVVTWIE
ncbi:NAD(P)H-dependent oxidoreductase [Campylobacter sp. faydin G-105]|uniref:NAD(P)H-dependent oxidoreductase n=1 Tax=Campylobacter anatolicus TaxID=2829105 RepID=UPI001B95F0EF|nr:NAD(P)H-dependent oxidoreductase [Campylobacter anatolicus]MBR8461415.1 NAD(P)H-dependent oxidoreductase [Campylobacter anatolicus]